MTAHVGDQIMRMLTDDGSMRRFPRYQWEGVPSTISLDERWVSAISVEH